jgi:alanine racemase
MHATKIEIDTLQFIQNLQAIRNKVSKVKICLPVKANAYGHGILKIAQIAEPYIDYLAVACLDEGQLLRQNGITRPILVFGAFGAEDVAGLIANKLEITISSTLKATQIAMYCRDTGQTARVHIKVDTGMNRVGVRVETAPELLNYVLSLPELELVGVYSHLASADEEDKTHTLDQISKFKQIVKLARSLKPDIICHLANSAGVCYYPDSYFDMVRPGILSYGYFPRTLDESLAHIRPCFSLKSRVIYTKIVEQGQGISYNHRYITTSRTRVVTIPIGYGDGYPRMLSNIGEILLRNNKYTISGTICMDMLMVDIGENGIGYVDDEVVLIGQQGNSEITLSSVATKCQTIIYEILCGFNDRIPRIYR